tara:strand:+ start:4168 stop:4644 length:477 start_codon:yes stop_codon:yes gene_type:complete
MSKNITIRKLQSEDFDLGYIDLLSELTNTDKVSRIDFENTLKSISRNPNHQIWVILDSDSDSNPNKSRILASGTLIIEPKFIHSCSSLAHIEDIVVHPDTRGQGLGKKIVNHLIECAKQQPNCYKISLNCSYKNIPFYTKLGLTTKERQMILYLNKEN